MFSEKEFNTKLFPVDRWFSPSWIIDTFDYYVDQAENQTMDREEALKKVIKHRNTKKLKEMWATAVFLLGYEKITACPHWLQPCVDTSPDALGVCFIQSEKFKVSHSQAQIFIEITEWSIHTDHGLTERIKDKLSKKAYPDYYHLVVHITRTGRVNTDLDIVSEELSKLDLKVAGVWIVVGSSKLGVKDNHMIVWLWPKKAKYEFSLSTAVEQDRKNKFPPLMMINKKKGKGFYDLEVVSAELPSLFV